MSRFGPLAVALGLLGLVIVSSEAIFSIAYFRPEAFAIGIWMIIGLGGGGALVYYGVIAPRRTLKQETPHAEIGATPDQKEPR